jgi:hypothetical protein
MPEPRSGPQHRVTTCADQETGVRVRYEIQVKGVLDAHWAEWFEGLDLRAEGETTVISGPLPDQAALHGVLAKVRDLGLQLLAVNTVDQGRG